MMAALRKMADRRGEPGLDLYWDGGQRRSPGHLGETPDNAFIKVG